MATQLGQRAAVSNVSRACADLDKRYAEAEAIDLAQMFTRCLPIISQPITDECTLAQQVARSQVHLICLALDLAIRQAVVCLHRELQDTVVEQVRELRVTLAQYRRLAGW